MTDVAPMLVLAALVGIADTVPYIRDTLHGATRPHRGTWLIWSGLAAGAVGAADPALLLYPLYFALVNGAIAVLIHHRRSALNRRVGALLAPADARL